MANREPKVHYNYKSWAACGAGNTMGYGPGLKRTDFIDKVTCGRCKYSIPYKNAKKRATGNSSNTNS